MKVLIIGGTRFIGKAIVNECLNNGHEVILFNRNQTKSEFDIPIIKGDIKDILNFKDEILSHNFDIAVHCIAYTPKHGSDCVEILKNTRTHLIVLSSCDSYDTFQGLNRNEDRIEIPLKENSKLSEIKYYWRDFARKGEWAQDYDKNLMAQRLIDSFNKNEIKPTIFKLPMVYGPEDYQYPGRHGDFIQRILDRRKTLMLSDREQCQVYTYGYIENISSAIVYSFKKEQCYGETYNLGEDQSRTRRKWAELYAEYAQWRFDVQIIPEELILMDKNYRNAHPQHLVTLNLKYKEHTGFSNPVSLKTAVQRTFDYAKANPTILGGIIDYTKEDRLINKYFNHMEEIYEELK